VPVDYPRQSQPPVPPPRSSQIAEKRLGDLYNAKCLTGEWDKSVFCAIGDGNEWGNLVGSMRLIPGPNGYEPTSTAVVLLNLCNTIYAYIERLPQFVLSLGSLATGMNVKTFAQNFRQHINQLADAVAVNTTITPRLLEPLAQDIRTLMDNGRTRPFLEQQMRNYGIAVYGMGNPVPQAPSLWSRFKNWIGGRSGGAPASVPVQVNDTATLNVGAPGLNSGAQLPPAAGGAQPGGAPGPAGPAPRNPYAALAG
jgi:hypothetical protein